MRLFIIGTILGAAAFLIGWTAGTVASSSPPDDGLCNIETRNNPTRIIAHAQPGTLITGWCVYDGDTYHEHTLTEPATRTVLQHRVAGARIRWYSVMLITAEPAYGEAPSRLHVGGELVTAERLDR
jgi:hypothetical protein